MRAFLRIDLIVLIAVLSSAALAQTAEELVAKNIQAKGGLEKLRAIQSVRMSGTQDNDGFKAAVAQENKRPNLVRETFALQGMTSIQAYDGSSGWQVRPFGGRKDPELMGEEDLRGCCSMLTSTGLSSITKKRATRSNRWATIRSMATMLTS